MKQVTVAICTYNRCKILREVLTGLSAQDVCADDFEVLVVDNASTDDTRQVVESFQPKYELRYVYESQPGSNFSRNRAIAEACTPITAYLDDDAVPEPGWLAAILETYRTVTPTPAAVGGKILIRWPGGVPEWAHEDIYGPLFAYTDMGETMHPCGNLFGPNVSFRTDILRQYGGFDTRLGVTPNSYIANDETELQERIRKDGHQFYYHPRAVVWHVVPEVKLNQKYMLMRCYDKGRSDAMMLAINGWPGRGAILADLVNVVWNYRRWMLRFLVDLVLGKHRYPPKEQFLIRSQITRFRGRFQELLRLYWQGQEPK